MQDDSAALQDPTADLSDPMALHGTARDCEVLHDPTADLAALHGAAPNIPSKQESCSMPSNAQSAAVASTGMQAAQQMDQTAEHRHVVRDQAAVRGHDSPDGIPEKTAGNVALTLQSLVLPGTAAEVRSGTRSLGSTTGQLLFEGYSQLQSKYIL